MSSPLHVFKWNSPKIICDRRLGGVVGSTGNTFDKSNRLYFLASIGLSFQYFD